MFPTCSDLLNSGTLDIRAALVSVGEETIFEYYSPKADAQTLFPIYSITKSIVALGYGLLVAKKGYAFLKEPVFPYLQEHCSITCDSRIRALTFEHLLTQSSGIKWREMGAAWGPGNPLWDMEHHHDWISFVLAKEFSTNPGRHFNYNSGASHLLPYLMGKVLGVDVGELFLEEIFFPLGIDRMLWETDPQENPTGGKGISLRAMDLLSIGQMVVNRGHFRGKQIIQDTWLEACCSKKMHVSGFYGDYGYQWWIRPEGVIAAMGFGGQYLLLDRARELSVAVVGNLGTQHFAEPLKLFEQIRSEIEVK